LVPARRLAGVLIDDVAQLEPALVKRLIKHEVDRSHMTGMSGAQPLLLPWTYPSALAYPHGPPQSLLAPYPAGALAVERPAFAQQDLVRGLPTPTLMLPGDLAQARSEALLLGAWRAWLPALRGAMLADHTARTAL
jgi:hypothetical protein